MVRRVPGCRCCRPATGGASRCQFRRGPNSEGHPAGHRKQKWLEVTRASSTGHNYYTGPTAFDLQKSAFLGHISQRASRATAGNKQPAALQLNVAGHSGEAFVIRPGGRA